MKWESVIVIALLLLSLMPLVKAENGPWWVKSYGGSKPDVARAVAVADNGDIIVVGWTASFGAGWGDVWVLRLDTNGNVKWQKTYGGKGWDLGYAVAIAENGDIIVTGSFTMRLDADGNIIWAKNVGGKALALAPNGDIIVAGSTKSFGAGSDDVWVLRLDSNGNIIWQKTYGGKYSDVARAVAVAENGDIVIAGSYGERWTCSNNSCSLTNPPNLWVLRLDADGNVKWQRTYGGSDKDLAFAVAVAENGDIIVAGYTESFGAGSADVWVLRLDSQGNIKWQKTYGGSKSDLAFAVAIAPNGDIIVAGWTYSFGAGYYDVWVLRLDADGNVKWQKTYGGNFGNDGAYAVALAPNGGIIVVGWTKSFGAGEDDIWVLKLPPNGKLLGCELCKDSNAVVESSSAELENTNAVVGQSNAVIKTSSAKIISPIITVKRQYLDLNSKIQEAQSIINKYKSQGIILRKAETLLSKAQQAFQQGDYTSAYNYASQALEKAEEIKNQHDQAKSKIGEVGNLVSYLQSNNVVFSQEILEVFNEAQTAFKNGDYEKAYALASQVADKAWLIKVRYNRAHFKINDAQTVINNYKSQGIILTDAETLLSKAQQAFDAGRYVDAYDYALKAVEKAEEIKKEFNRAKSELEKAQSKVGNYKSENIVLSEAENLLNKAQQAFQQGDYTNAYNYASRALEKAEEIKTQYDKAKPVFETAKSLFEYFQENSVVVPFDVRGLFKWAQEEFNSGDYSTAYILASQFIEKANPIKEEFDKAKPELEKAQTTINNYKSQGIILTETEALLTKAQQAFQQGDYITAYNYASQALEKAKEIKDQYEKAKEAISQAEGFLSPLGAAKAAFEKGDYVTAYQLAVEAAEKRDLYQKLFALGIILAVVSGSVYALHRRREREREVG